MSLSHQTFCRQSLGMQFSYPKNKSVMNKIRDGLLKESLFNILSKKRDDLFCIVNKYIHFVHSEYHFIQGDSE